jgi:hyperosmotically inducible periplasmic protein
VKEVTKTFMKKMILKSLWAWGASGLLLVAQTTPNQAGSSQAGSSQGAPASTDSEMTSKVREVLMNDNHVGAAAQHIRVNTRNGVVTLRGKVDSSAERDEAITKAKQVAGDANVKDEISVKK